MDTYEHHSHISITRHTREGVTRTDVHITSMEASDGQHHHSMPHDDHECFNPDSCCDAQERALIAMMRAYLRPQTAPECLFERLHRTLDACCREEECEHGETHTDIPAGDSAQRPDAAHQTGGAVVVRRVRVPGTEVVTVADLSFPSGWTFPAYPDVR